MTNTISELPPLPLPTYYTLAGFTLDTPGGTYCALGPLIGGVCIPRVFRLKDDHSDWEVVKGPWEVKKKINAASLSQENGNLRVAFALEHPSVKGQKSYPMCHWTVEGAAAWTEHPLPLNKADYVTNADLNNPLDPKATESKTEDGRWFEPLALRITKQLRALRQLFRFAKFWGLR